jgi:formylmethanofuran dehydrogenase subunit E
VKQQNDEIKEIKEYAEKTMGENGHLLSQLEQAGKLHGHICPSLFYGVSLAMRIREWMQASSNDANQPACGADSDAADSDAADSGTSGAACEIILEGKSQCIRDGVRSVLGEGTPFTVQSTGQCALTAVCTTDQHQITDQHQHIYTDQPSCADQQCYAGQQRCADQPRYRLSISPAVRGKINELNQSLPLEEFKRVGVAYLKSLSPRELFGE